MTLISDGPRALERFHAKYMWDPVTDCMIWVASRNRQGYGHVNYQGRGWRAHRVAHELFIGPIPDGFVVDHKCERKACVNPEHLQAITFEQNLRLTLTRRGKFRCGHTRIGHNAMMDNYNGSLRCRTCVYGYQQAWKAKQCS